MCGHVTMTVCSLGIEASAGVCGRLCPDHTGSVLIS